MATSKPLPQRPTRKSRRLRGQEPQQATPEKVVGSVATPPFGGLSPCGHLTPLVLSATGGLAQEATIFYKRLASMLSSTKHTVALFSGYDAVSLFPSFVHLYKRGQIIMWAPYQICLYIDLLNWL